MGNTVSCTWWRHQMETFSALLAFVRVIHRPPVNSPLKGQWRRVLMFSLICAWMNGWVNNRETGDLRRHRAHYDVIVMTCQKLGWSWHPRNLDDVVQTDQQRSLRWPPPTPPPNFRRWTGRPGEEGNIFRHNCNVIDIKIMAQDYETFGHL